MLSGTHGEGWTPVRRGTHQLHFKFDDGELVLLSIRPEPFRMIKAGEKKYEYRRVYLSCATTAVLYVSSPVMAICGVAEFGTPIVDTVDRIAQIAESEHAGWGSATREYLRGLRVGYAIPVLSFREVSPIGISELKTALGAFTPPQSYLVLRNHPALKACLELRLFMSPGQGDEDNDRSV